LYNSLALPVLLYGSENWTVKWKDKFRLTAVEWSSCKRLQNIYEEITKPMMKY
jgi:hypothetical protein